MTGASFTITDARYAKGKRLIRPMDGRDGMKGPSAYMADAVGGRWTNREKGYIVSVAAEHKFRQLLHAGFSANVRVFNGQPASFDHAGKRLENLTLSAALKIAKGA